MILIGTDFSAGSLHAAKIGLLIARKTDSKVMLVHAFKAQSRSGMFMSMDRYIRQAAEQDMAEFVAQIDPELHPFIQEARVVRGFAEEVIMQWDEEQEFGLVVVGTQGSSAIREIFMGRTANILLNKLRSPILAIPSESREITPQGLVFAWDGRTMDRKTCENLLEWASLLGIPLEVMHVHTEHSPPCDPIVKSFFEEKKIGFIIISGEGDVKDEIDEYLQKFPNHWLTLIKRERGFFEPFFHDSMVKRELFSTTNPILII
ncbi:MAG: universal stress protein [Saprospiraceae bacterium]|nr:universal stress protein [Saprospiraceae bacterium]